MTGATLPTLSSPRLLLEPLSLDHSAGMFSMWREPAVCRFSGVAYDSEGRRIGLPATSAAESLGFQACGQIIDDAARYYLPLDFPVLRA